MKKIILITSLFLINTFHVLSNEPKLSEQINGLRSPWSISFVDDSKALITEKSGNLVLVDLNSKKIKKIVHNLNILEDGQGGLLEVLYYNNQIFVSYSENLKKGKSSTSVAVAKFNENSLNFKNIFRAEPPINSGYHFGSRLVIKDRE
jgi:quinoprotein glucose dehydrogenase